MFDVEACRSKKDVEESNNLRRNQMAALEAMGLINCEIARITML